MSNRGSVDLEGGSRRSQEEPSGAKRSQASDWGGFNLSSLLCSSRQERHMSEIGGGRFRICLGRFRTTFGRFLCDSRAVPEQLLGGS
jgi:hypothetical protein